MLVYRAFCQRVLRESWLLHVMLNNVFGVLQYELKEMQQGEEAVAYRAYCSA